MAAPDQYPPPNRNPAPNQTPASDGTILDNLTSYRRSYGDQRKFEEEEGHPPDTIRALFLSLEEVRRKLSDLQEQVKRGKLEIFNFEGKYNPETKGYVLKKKVLEYTEDNPSRVKRYIFKRLRLLVDVLHKHVKNLLEKKKKVGKPDLGYLTFTGLKYSIQNGYREARKSAYESSSGKVNVKELLSDDILRICCTLECMRESLLIDVQMAGHFAGDIRFKVRNSAMNGLDEIPGGTTGQYVPTKGLRTMENIIIGNDVTCILIVENHALFSVLWQSNYHNVYKCILVNTSGHPDLCVREFLYRITAADETLPVFCLCDLDVGGYYIVEGLKLGTKNTAFMHKYSRCKRLQWLGIRPSDITKYDLQPDYNADIPFSEQGLGKLRAHKENFGKFPLPSWEEELNQMMNLSQTVQLQGCGIVDKYLLCKLEDVADWGDRCDAYNSMCMHRIAFATVMNLFFIVTVLLMSIMYKDQDVKADKEVVFTYDALLFRNAIFSVGYISFDE